MGGACLGATVALSLNNFPVVRNFSRFRQHDRSGTVFFCRQLDSALDYIWLECFPGERKVKMDVSEDLRIRFRTHRFKADIAARNILATAL